MTTVNLPPAGLGPRGLRFWRQATDSFELSDAEAEVLHEVCRTLDNLDSLAAAIAENGPTAVGSTGQMVASPLLTEVRGQRLALRNLLAALDLPDLEGDAARLPSTRSVGGKRAAAARWRGHQPVTGPRTAG